MIEGTTLHVIGIAPDQKSGVSSCKEGGGLHRTQSGLSGQDR